MTDTPKDHNRVSIEILKLPLAIKASDHNHDQIVSQNEMLEFMLPETLLADAAKKCAAGDANALQHYLEFIHKGAILAKDMAWAESVQMPTVADFCHKATSLSHAKGRQ